MTKKKETCRYELLCLLHQKSKNQDKYEKMIKNLEELLGKENIEKIEEKDWKPVYIEEGSYVLINFSSPREKIKQLEKELIKLKSSVETFLDRYLLINLENEKINKTKLKEKNAE